MEKISDLHKTAKTQLFEAVNHYNFNQFLSQTVSINTKEIIANISDLLSSNSDQVWLDSLQSLLSLKSLISSLQLFHELIDSGEVLEASDLIVDILNNIQILEKLSKKDCNHCPEFIIDILYQQYLDRLSTLKYFLNDVFSMAFVFHSRSEFTSLTVSSRVMNTCTGKNAPNKKFLLSPISIESLYSSMEKIGILEARMFRFCESLISLFLKPILANTQLLLFSEKKATSNCLKYRKDVRKSNSETQSSLDSIKSLLTFGQFIKSTVFANINLSGTSMALKYFYKSFHKTLVTELSTSVIAASLPTENGKLEIFIDLARSILKPFETEWIELSLIPQFNTDIDDLISHIPFIYAIERRNSLLQVARDIILSDDWNTVTVEEATEQGGLSLLFGNQKGFNSEKSAKEGLVSVDSSASDLKLQKCQVSVQAQTIIETVYQTLSEAKNSTVEGAAELFFLARDIIDLYRALYPVHHAASLSAFPGRASLFLNDTEYFSHHLFTIGEFLKRNCSDKDAHFLVFGNGIDVVDDFRRIGQQIYRHMMRSQRDQLVLFLDQISFAGLSSDEKLENVEKTVRDAMYHLLGLGRTLKPILSRTIYLETVGVFLDSVLKVLFDHLSLLENDTSLLNRSLSREDTFQICYVLGILEKCRSLFEFKSGLKEIEHAPIPKYSKSWPQLTSVVKTFEKSLVGDFSEQSIYEYLMQFK